MFLEKEERSKNDWGIKDLGSSATGSPCQKFKMWVQVFLGTAKVRNSSFP